MSASSQHPNPVNVLKAWLDEPLEDRVMALVEDPSLLELVRDLIEQHKAFELRQRQDAREYDELEAERDGLKEQYQALERAARDYRLLVLPYLDSPEEVGAAEELDYYLSRGSNPARES